MHDDLQRIAAAKLTDPTDVEHFLDVATYTDPTGQPDTTRFTADLTQLTADKPHLARPRPSLREELSAYGLRPRSETIRPLEPDAFRAELAKYGLTPRSTR